MITTAATAELLRPAGDAGTASWHLRETMWLAAPIAASLLSEMVMGLISAVMLGGLGPQALAAGGLAISLFFTSLIILQGVLSGVGVLAATMLGAGQGEDVPSTYWSGVLLACFLAVPLFVGLSLAAPLLRAIGEPAPLADDIGAYLRVLRWAVPAGVVGIGMMRQFLPAVGLQHVLLWVMPFGVVLHGGVSWLLIKGGLGLPAHGIAGSAAAIVVTLSAISVAMLALLHRPRSEGPGFHRYVRIVRPSVPRLGRLLAIGLPVSVSVVMEAGLFMATGMMAGRFGPDVLAAHMIALNVASVTFMVPLALSQAGNVRVAAAAGAGQQAQARRAGFCTIGLSMVFMSAAALLLTVAPGLIVSGFLGATTPASAATVAIACQLLGVAAVFEIADGTQVAASAALRGLQDVRVPMLVAILGYWGGGFSTAWLLGFRYRLGAIGLWWGLCIGLSVVAVCLTARFARRSACD